MNCLDEIQTDWTVVAAARDMGYKGARECIAAFEGEGGEALPVRGVRCEV